MLGKWFGFMKQLSTGRVRSRQKPFLFVRLALGYIPILLHGNQKNLRLPQDQDLALDDPDKVFDVMAAVRDFAAQMAKREAHRKWRSACGQIISATRRAEELLQPLLLVDVCPEESDVFTHPTAQSHSQAPLAESVTAVTWNAWNVTEETDAFNLPDAVAGGETEARIQAFEHQLLELRNTHKNTDHPEIAVVLHNLGNLSRHAGDLKQSEQYCQESLDMKCSLYEHEYHPEIAVTLNELGNLSWKAGDLNQAKQYYNESLRMKRSLHGDRDHPEIAVTLHALGNLSRQAGDLNQAKQYCNESLRMKHSLYGDTDHHQISVTLNELGNLSRQAGDLTQAKQYYEESLRMKRSVHGDGDHREIAVTLHELGMLSREAGDLNQAKQYLEESLRMKRSLYGDRHHPEIAVTLHELGSLSRRAGDPKQAKQYYNESLRMKRSLYGDRDHPDIAATLHELGNLSRQAGDLTQAKQYFDESLQMDRSLHGDRDHPYMYIAVTLHELGNLSRETGDLRQVDRNHSEIAVTCCDAGSWVETAWPRAALNKRCGAEWLDPLMRKLCKRAQFWRAGWVTDVLAVVYQWCYMWCSALFASFLPRVIDFSFPFPFVLKTRSPQDQIYCVVSLQWHVVAMLFSYFLFNECWFSVPHVSVHAPPFVAWSPSLLTLLGRGKPAHRPHQVGRENHQQGELEDPER